jgi:predicted metal-dependent enzyme (double-stranded beta helix superfamily)
MSKIATFLSTRVEADVDLSRPELLELSAAIGVERSLWEDQVRLDAADRHYVQLYRDPNVDVWLICWADEQSTGYHDHDRSQGAVYVCDGAVFEDFFHRDEDGWIRERTNRHTAGAQFDFDAAYIHGVRYAAGAPAVSVHVYSPALWRMGHYEADENGIMRRVSMTYADELLGAA